MRMLPAFAVGLVAYVLGVFVFSQILGNLQNIKTQGAVMSILAVVMWALVLASGYFLAWRFIPAHANHYLLGLALAFVLLLKPARTR